MTRSKRIAAAAAATLIACGAVTPGGAAAQNVIPGDLNPGKVVVTWLPGVTVNVTQPSLERVEVAVTNTSGIGLRCSGPNDNSRDGITVTTGPVAQAAMQYYANFEHKPDPADSFGSGAYGAQIEWNAILSFLPTGSVAPMFGPAYAARDWISRQHDAARAKGHTGTSTSFGVGAGGTTKVDVPLSPPSHGPRTEFDAAAFFVCTSGANTYAFAGYENAPPSSPGTGAVASGSLGPR